jgi:hypothetical protein
MPAFLFKLESADGEPAEPPELSTVVYTWKAGDEIPLGQRLLRVIGLRDENADEPRALIVSKRPASQSVLKEPGGCQAVAPIFAPKGHGPYVPPRFGLTMRFVATRSGRRGHTQCPLPNRAAKACPRCGSTSRVC